MMEPLIELPKRSVEVKLRSMFDLRALSMSLRDAFLKQRESEFFSLSELLKQGQLESPLDPATFKALRYAFHMTWVKNDFTSLVKAGKNLSEEILQREPLLAAYIAESQEMLKNQDNSVDSSIAA